MKAKTRLRSSAVIAARERITMKEAIAASAVITITITARFPKSIRPLSTRTAITAIKATATPMTSG